MRFKPFIQEVLRDPLKKMDDLDPASTRPMIVGLLVVCGVLVGFGVGNWLGFGGDSGAEDLAGAHESTYTLATQTLRGTDSSEASSLFGERGVDEYGALAAVGAGPSLELEFADTESYRHLEDRHPEDIIADDAFDAADTFTAEEIFEDATDAGDFLDHSAHEVTRGAVVAQYAPVSIESLPIHRQSPLIGPAESLTIVTRGEIGKGESLGSSLRRQGISPGTVHLIATEMRKIFDFRRSRPGDEYRLGQDSDGRVLDFRYSQGPEESYYLGWEGTRYVVRKETAELRPQVAKIAGVVDSSFYGAVMALGEQSALASEFSRILAWDIDFSRNVHPGDEFSILYERMYRRNDDGEDEYVRPGRILAGRYAGRAGNHTVVLFEDEFGHAAYFRPDGSSIERAFLAAPLEFSRISSRFTRARHHPILNITRPHPGIDYAAPRGTPIWAVADGVVEYKARAGASGNLIRIRHAGGYTSHYAHLSKFATDLSVGDRVEQKQIIGYVGSTGLSTGPHVCFRVKKDGRYVDPMKISSPAGEPVIEEKIELFQHVRDQLLADLGPGPLSLADEAL